MKVAIWTSLEAELLARADHRGIDLVRCSPGDAGGLLKAGVVDAALIPVLDSLADPDAFDGHPQIAISTWRRPTAMVDPGGPLDALPPAILSDRDTVQEAVVARVVFKEHYHVAARIVRTDLDEQVDDGPSAVLFDGLDPGLDAIPATALDLGEEWYELANYPMVWSLFATRKGELDLEIFVALRDWVFDAVARREELISTMNEGIQVSEYLMHEVRYRLDDLAIASMTEFGDLAYFHGVIDEVGIVPLTFPAGAEDLEEPSTGT